MSSTSSRGRRRDKSLVVYTLQRQRAAVFIVPPKDLELRVLGFTLQNTERDSWSATLSATHQITTTVEGSRLSSDNVMLRNVWAKLT